MRGDMMREVLRSIFGTYTPISVTETTADGATVVRYLNGLAGVDWEYVGGVLLFSIVLYCLFRILGGVMK